MSLWTRLFGRAPSAALAKPSASLRVESLEDRSVPAVLDLTAAGAAGTVNDALFEQFDGHAVARRELDTFLELHAWGNTTQGVNTNAHQFQEGWGWQDTHAVKVADLPAVTVNGVKYREVVLNVTQPGHSPLVSLDELKVYVSNSASPGRYQASTGKLGGLTPRYDLDAGGDNWVKLDAGLNGRNPRGDMLLYLPDSLLSGGKYLHLYSKFGANSSAQCGSVNWSFGRHGAVGHPTPPPAQTGSISGVVFEDQDNSGTQDPGEPVVVGRVVWLDANNNGMVDPGEPNTTTAADGSYHFDNLAGNASYTVRSFNDNGDYTPAQVVFVAPGAAVTGIDIGLFTAPNV